MIRLNLALAVLCALPASAAATRASKAKRPSRPAAAAPADKAPSAAAPELDALLVESPSDSPDEIALFGLGAALVSQDDGLLVAAVRPGSRADQAGLKAGDQLMRVDGVVATRAKAAAALRSWTPGTRLSIVVRRGLILLPLETAAVPAAKDYARGDKDLSDSEKAMAVVRSSQAVADGRAVVRLTGPLTVSVRTEQGLWTRFPKGLPAGLKKGDELIAEAATGLTVDATLDYLAVPPGSKVRARVLEAVDDGETRVVRLAFYAIDLNGGGTYTTLGYATAVSGDQRMARVGVGGALVAAAPLPDAKRRGNEPVLDTDARLRVRLLDPLIVDEPPLFWRTGPGLWVKTVENNGKRLFEITHAIAGRSADNAGLKIGERFDAIGGKATEKMDFAEAIDRLYGAPGSEVEVSVVRQKSTPMKLKRGLRWASGKSTPIPLAYNAQ